MIQHHLTFCQRSGDFILVGHSITEYQAFDSLSDWRARVLEVRTLDEEHVHGRGSWLDRPDDSDDGRQYHHSKDELVPMDQMYVINAQSGGVTFKLIRYNRLPTSRSVRSIYLKSSSWTGQKHLSYAVTRRPITLATHLTSI